MKRNTETLLKIILLMTMASCSPRYVPMHESHSDTVYIHQLEYDSIYLNHEVWHERAQDTVFLTERTVEFRYRYLHDTVQVVCRDSIPYPVPVPARSHPLVPQRYLLFALIALIGVSFALLVRR